MEDSQLEKKVSEKPMGVTLGDIGVVVGATLGIGYTLLSNDADTGHYITDVTTNFANRGYLAVTGFTAAGYTIGRLIDIFKE